MNNWKAHAAVLSANVIFGANFSAVQHITTTLVKPFGLNLIRVGVSLVLLWILILFSTTSPGIQRRHVGRFVLCALTGVAINQTLFISGLTLTLSIHAALLILVTPIFITVLAAWVARERPGFYRIAGLLTGVTGACILALDRTGKQTGSNIFWGDVFIVINSISYACYFVLVRPLMKEYNPVHVIRWVFTFGFFFVLPFGWNQVVSIEWQAFTAWDMSLLAFIVIGATFLAYLFNLYGINRLGPSVTGTYIYTQPVFASVIAILFLGETYTLYKIIAAGLIAGGVVMVSRKRNKD